MNRAMMALAILLLLTFFAFWGYLVIDWIRS